MCTFFLCEEGPQLLILHAAKGREEDDENELGVEPGTCLLMRRKSELTGACDEGKRE